MEANWTTIAEELDEIAVGFADEEEAIVEMTEAIAAEPEEEAERFVRQIARIGKPRLRLGELLRTPETWGVELPDSCPLSAKVDWFNKRGVIHSKRGELQAAATEFERLQAVSESDQADEDDVKRWRSWALGHPGLVARKRGDMDDAERYLEEPAGTLLDVGIARDALKVLDDLVDVTEQQGKVDAATEWCE